MPPLATNDPPPRLEGYNVEAEIGRGGFGIVYKGSHGTLAIPVAIKTLPTYADSGDEEVLKRFLREARIIAKVEHPNIVRLFDVRLVKGVPYLVMEYVDGGSLVDLLRPGQPLPLADALRLVREAAAALHAVHEEGIIHRDVKPENILLTKRGQVKMVDFGVAHVDNDTYRTRTGQILGTPHFMSPEQVQGIREIGRFADIYSLGVVLYNAVCGRLPFLGSNSFAIAYQHANEPPTPPREFIPDLPVGVEAAILRALEKKPEDRWQTAAEFGAALEPFLPPELRLAIARATVIDMPAISLQGRTTSSPGLAIATPPATPIPSRPVAATPTPPATPSAELPRVGSGAHPAPKVTPAAVPEVHTPLPAGLGESSRPKNPSLRRVGAHEASLSAAAPVASAQGKRPPTFAERLNLPPWGPAVLIGTLSGSVLIVALWWWMNR